MRIIILPLSTASRLVIAQRTSSHALPPRFDDRLAQRAHNMWTTWESSTTWWKIKVTKWGNAAMDRIPYDEWSLKGVPRPPAGLLPTHPKKWWEFWKRNDDLRDRNLRDREFLMQSKRVPLVYPPGLIKDHEAAEFVRQLAEKGLPYHFKYMVLSLVGAPLTLPVALIPLIPNIPGFYLLYRAWSHWKAWEGAKVLKRIVDENKFVLEPSHVIEAVYRSEAPMVVDLPGGSKGEKMLLEDSQVTTLAKAMDAEEVQAELHRALAQVRVRIKKEAQQKMKEEDKTEKKT
ncbi:mitochondrial K+-H+ exchange-related-domain-containing protein [Lipomyces tetrasporus]|uniref:Mitochondrial K+-H+ exchange-related-domain-containing protein n=1 Tax=Lipomyces tetrasporus TaxID=54092 RepID=A0AAD7QTF6_9ASCO|nr:mitochondrial K+-H+ exchange-related-domain-containing protein [Lipomyces tetrasporus]KAJ8101173.1 mitochondrial K+-H+ exchange-related-domain-containing protein [Lipomyces tetrasporus]